MALRLKDKNKTIFIYRSTPNGAVLTKGKRQIHLIFKSVNQGERAKRLIKENSFNKLFTKGRKIKLLGSNVSCIKFK